MIALDANILIYAHRTDSPFHKVAARRLAELAAGTASWAIPWPCLHEFLAIVTNRRVYNAPATLDEALGFVSALLEAPGLVLLSETETHWAELTTVLTRGQVTGGRVHDARIAAICLEHQVSVLWSADRDFNRFPALTVVNPLVS